MVVVLPANPGGTYQYCAVKDTLCVEVSITESHMPTESFTYADAVSDFPTLACFQLPYVSTSPSYQRRPIAAQRIDDWLTVAA